MYKKILVISDNLSLSQKFIELINNVNQPNIEWGFGISPFSNLELFKSEVREKLKKYDLSNNRDVDYIIKNYELVFSIHCKQLFPRKMVESLKCINVHPGYNPINRGWYPQVFAILNDLPIGATIHEIDNKLDHGPIIARKYVKKEMYDTSKSLYDKVINAEIELLKENLSAILKNDYETMFPESEGNLYLKEDFKRLCKLDLNETLTTLQFINKFRALSHGDFKNTYFIDPKTDERIYVSIKLEKE